MKNLIILITLICAFTHISAQQKPDYTPIENGTKQEKIAKANEVALQAAKYLLATPIDTNDEDIKQAASYLLMWMTVTEEYSFEIGNAAMELCGSNKSLLSRYLAAMVEYEMNNPENKDDKHKVGLYAAQKLIKYAQDPAHNAVMHSELKKAAKADKNGKLAEHLTAIDEG